MSDLTLTTVRTILSGGELDGKRLPLIEFVDRQAAQLKRLRRMVENFKEQAEQGVMVEHDCPAMFACASIVADCFDETVLTRRSIYESERPSAAEHCRDCCCARSWAALGVSGYTGLSIPEHIALLLAMVRKYASECGDCDGLGSIEGDDNQWRDCARCADIRAVIKGAT